MIIDVAASLGFVWSRKRAHGLWEKRRKRWIELYGQDPVGGLKGYPPFQVTHSFDHFQRIKIINSISICVYISCFELV